MFFMFKSCMCHRKSKWPRTVSCRTTPESTVMYLDILPSSSATIIVLPVMNLFSYSSIVPAIP